MNETARCESGWTGDRCTFPLGHDGEHSNVLPPRKVADGLDPFEIRVLEGDRYVPTPERLEEEIAALEDAGWTEAELRAAYGDR